MLVSYLVFKVQVALKQRIHVSWQKHDTSFGDDGGGEPRVPISNTTVKPSSADGTWTEGSWESRTSPSGYENIHCMILHLENWITKERNAETSFSK